MERKKRTGERREERGAQCILRCLPAVEAYSSIPRGWTRANLNQPSGFMNLPQTTMNDTYAVVNKPKHQPASDPASSAVATPSFSRTLPPSHNYDNDPSSASAPIYSVVRPRGKPHSLPLSATPLYYVPPPANQKPGDSREYHLSPAGGLSPTDDDYEVLCSSAPDVSGLGSPGGIGFNCRIQKPRGPRDPPADWSRLER